MALKLSGNAKSPARKPGLSLGKPGNSLKPNKVAASTGPKAKYATKPGGTFERAERAQQDYERKKAMPWRASIPVGSEGVQVYFLDNGEPFSMYEHNIGGTQTKAGKQYPCIKDTNEPCPACMKDPKGDGYFIMLLTAVIPKLTITTKDGETKTYHFQKKEWPVKIKMMKKYKRLYQAHGTFRGMVVSISRDAKTDPSTGNEVEFVRMMTEAEIKKFANNPKYAEAKLAEPFDFAKIHKLPSAQELRKMLGGSGNDDTAGGADFASDDDDFGGAADDGGWGDD